MFYYDRIFHSMFYLEKNKPNEQPFIYRNEINADDLEHIGHHRY